MSDFSRRSLLAGSCTTVALAVLPNSLTWGKTPANEAQTPNEDFLARMTWFNEPASWKRSGDQVIARSRPKTDFWRKTFVEHIIDNGHFFHLSVSGMFSFEARVNGQFSAPFDQAGVMVRLDPENWMKCGMEFFEGQRQASVVFTRDFSDWSTMKILPGAAPVWWRAARHKNSIEIYYSLDGQSFTLIRSGYFSPSPQAEVGLMCAAPQGEGFEATFDCLKLSVEKG